MKTIVYVGGFELPDKNAAAQRVIGNSNALKELGYEIILLGVSKKEKNLKDYKEINNFKYYEKLYPKTVIDWILYLVNIKDVVNTMKKYNTIEYLICYNYPAIALWRLRSYCKKGILK